MNFGKKNKIYILFIPKFVGSGTHYLKFCGFPGTHGTHTNGATVMALKNMQLFEFELYLTIAPL